MKILYIHQYFNTPNEPGGTRSYWFAKELIAKGHEVVMLTSTRGNRGGSFIEKKSVEGIEVIYVNNPYDNSMGIMSRLWSFIKFMIISTWLGVKEKDVDLVYATSTPLTVGIPAMFIKWINGTKYIFEVRDLWPEVPIQMKAITNKLLIKLLRRFEKQIYKQSSHIVALSPGMRDGVIAAGISPEKVSMIPNMAKIDKFFMRERNTELAASLGIDSEQFNAIHFGSMGTANGLNYIVDAAVCLQERGVTNVKILFMGKGKTEAELMKVCEEKNLQNVKFLGRYPMDIVSEVVNLCDCSLVSFADIPILYTNSPNKFFDSLSAGKPIIVNSGGWTKDIVEKYECGLYVNPQRPEDLAEALIKISNNQEWMNNMARNSRQLAENVYDKSILCRKFIEVINTFDSKQPVLQTNLLAPQI